MTLGADERIIVLVRASGRILIRVRRGNEVFAFWYDDASCSEVVFAASKWALNPDLLFDAVDAKEVGCWSQREFLSRWPVFMLENQIANSLAKRRKDL